MKSNCLKRIAWVTGLRAERAARYEELHANIWPGVKARLAASGIRNFSIHKVKIQGGTYLFAHMEYTGTDLAADMKAIEDDPEVRHWWKETDACQAPLPEAMAKGQIWVEMEEVFFERLTGTT